MFINQSYFNLGKIKNKKKSLRKQHHGLSVINGSREPDIEKSKIIAKLELYPDDFYTEDIVCFFLLKTKNIEEKVIVKYKCTLNILGDALSRNEALSWEDIDYNFWEELITVELLINGREFFYKQLNCFFDVLIQFTKWLDLKHKWNHTKIINHIIDENKHSILDCFYIQKELTTKTTARYLEESYNFAKFNKINLTGLYLVENIKSQFIYAYDLVTRKRIIFELPIKLDKKILGNGKVYHAIVERQSKKNNYNLLHLECIYPPTAVPYLKTILLD